MAIIHYDVTFVKCPSLNQIKDKLDSRMGLRTHLVKDSIEGCHAWPHIGQVRESGTFESGETAKACRGSALLRRSRGAGVPRGPDERPHFPVDGTGIVDFRLRARR